MLRTVKAISICVTTLAFGCVNSESERQTAVQPAIAVDLTLEVPETTVVPHKLSQASRRIEDATQYVAKTGKEVNLLIDGGVTEPDPKDQCVAAVTVSTVNSDISLTPRVAANIPDIEDISRSVHLDVDTGGGKELDLESSDIKNAPAIRNATGALLSTAKEGCQVWVADIEPGL